MDTKARILVVDDDLSCRVLASLLLEVDGYQPVAVTSVERALEKLDGAHFDAVLTDLHMPLRSGLDLLLELKTRRDPTPAVVMTASADRELHVTALALGAVAVVPKPFSPAELDSAIGAAIASHGLNPLAA